jgi:hypothetical protein
MKRKLFISVIARFGGGCQDGSFTGAGYSTSRNPHIHAIGSVQQTIIVSRNTFS